MNHTLTLNKLCPGERARISEVKAQGFLRRRILEMGLVPGRELEMIRYAPLGNPIEIKLNGSYISLRQNEAQSIVLTSSERSEGRAG